MLSTYSGTDRDCSIVIQETNHSNHLLLLLYLLYCSLFDITLMLSVVLNLIRFLVLVLNHIWRSLPERFFFAEFFPRFCLFCYIIFQPILIFYWLWIDGYLISYKIFIRHNFIFFKKFLSLRFTLIHMFSFRNSRVFLHCHLCYPVFYEHILM